jgi:hypothetical protein
MAMDAIGAAADFNAMQFARPNQAAGARTLTPEQQQEVQKLRQIDRKVREHEAAHMAAGAGLAGGAHFEYVRGPDGRQYAVAGEVKIDVSPAQTPQQTIAKARRIQAAALAPADPSSQDRAVAAQAAQMAAKAQTELRRQEREEREAGQGGDMTSTLASTQASTRASRAVAAYAWQEAEPTSVLSLYA